MAMNKVVLQSNLNYPNFSIIRTCFSGPVFSWILITVMVNIVSTNFVWHMIDLFLVFVVMYFFINHWQFFHRFLHDDTDVCSWNICSLVNRHYIIWLINIHIFHYPDSQLSRLPVLLSPVPKIPGNRVLTVYHHYSLSKIIWNVDTTLQ